MLSMLPPRFGALKINVLAEFPTSGVMWLENPCTAFLRRSVLSTAIRAPLSASWL